MLAEITLAMPAQMEPNTTNLSRPRASLSGPTTTWNTPYASAKAVTARAAVPIVTPSSPAICGSSGSHTRKFAALANAASASRAMARVGVSPAERAFSVFFSGTGHGPWLGGGSRFVEGARTPARQPCSYSAHCRHSLSAEGVRYLQMRPSPSRPWRARSRWKWSR